MLIDNSAIKKAVTDAVDALETAGSESALDALIDLRDECDDRIHFERGRGRARVEALYDIFRHYEVCHPSGSDNSLELAMTCRECLDLSVRLRETLP